MRYEEMRGDMNRCVGYKKFPMAFKSIQVCGDKKEIQEVVRRFEEYHELLGIARRYEEFRGEITNAMRWTNQA